MEKLSTKVFKENNPLVHQNPRMDALREAYDHLLELLEEHSDEFELNDEEAEELAKILSEAFFEKKASIILDDKLSDINRNLHHTILRALKNYISKSEKEDFFDIYYYRNNLTHLNNG